MTPGQRLSPTISACFGTPLGTVMGLRSVTGASTYADPLTSKAQPHANSRDPGRRLRVGYVSADFRDHVIGQFIHPVLAHHDRRLTTIFVYSASTQEDVQTRRLKTLVHGWRNIADMDDEEATELIRADSIDCLVDLSGHSAGNRLLVFARKPAPVQLTWMGYLNTTGMSAMDYKVTDQIADPPGADVCYREKLMRLPSPQWCYSQEVKQPEAADSNIRTFHSRILLGCVARFMKINDDCIDLWIEVLRVVGNADLRLIDVPDHPRTAEILERFSRAGFSHRVSILPTLRGGEYWQRIKELDIALDPFPYTGATTTLDCLWMGVPVVTLAGAYGAERSAASILSGLCCEHLIARSRDEYASLSKANRRRSLVYQLRSLGGGVGAGTGEGVGGIKGTSGSSGELHIGSGIVAGWARPATWLEGADPSTHICCDCRCGAAGGISPDTCRRN